MYIKYTMYMHTLGIAQHGAGFTNLATQIYFPYTLTCYLLMTKRKTWNIEF